MLIEFDLQKDARNIALRGISLAAAEMLLDGFTVEWLTDEEIDRQIAEDPDVAPTRRAGRRWRCCASSNGSPRRSGARCRPRRRSAPRANGSAPLRRRSGSR
jgi:hypothetical protein